MVQFGFTVNTRCVLCSLYDDTHDHLFVTCPYTQSLLSESPVQLTCRWEDWLEGRFFQGQFPGWIKSLGYLYISLVTYSVWRERNSRIHATEGPKRAITLLSLIKSKARERVCSSASFRKCLAKNPSFSALLY